MPRDDQYEDFGGEPIDPHSAELQRALVALDKADGAGDEDFAPDTDDSRAIALVKEGEGRDLLADATDPARAFREAQETDPTDPTDDADTDDDGDRAQLPATTEKPTGKQDSEQAEDRPAAPADHEKLIAALPEMHRPAVKALAERAQQWGEIEQIAAPWMDALKQRGETVLDGIRSLAELNAFATQKPGEYMAWFTANAVPEANRAAALIQLGNALGVKLIEDEFGLDEDEGAEKPHPVDVNAAREQHRADQLITAFGAAAGPDGQPAHPLFDSKHPLSSAVHREMVRRIGEDAQAGKPRPQTIAQMRAYYDEAVDKITAAFPGNKAAQEKVAKAKRASSPVSASPAAPRRRDTPTTKRQDDTGGDELLAGLLNLYGTGAEE